MYFDFKEEKLNSILRLTDNVGLIVEDDSIQKGLIHILWNRGEKTIEFLVDGERLILKPNQISTITYMHVVKFNQPLPIDLVVISFNREFYCIIDHDHEVSCNGLLFMGSRDIPVLDVSEVEQKKLNVLLDVFQDEFQTKDNIQGEMLRMLLKRLIIKCTRLAKEQKYAAVSDNESIDLIRRFNILVNTHYKTHKQVNEYASMLFKSPKTLSNLFKIQGSKPPLQLIHERIVLEAQRQLLKTDKTAKEIAFDLGFEDVSVFNKLFKKCTDLSPVAYKKEKLYNREKSTIL